jgi:hypothetical protein
MTIPLFFGPYGGAALTHAERLAGYGANACWFHMFDEAAFETCARHGIAACVEFKTFRADFDAHPELVPIGADGQPIRYGRLVQGVCLSQPAFLEQIEADLRAGLQIYRPAGIWLDYLTYAAGSRSPTPTFRRAASASPALPAFASAPASTQPRRPRSSPSTARPGPGTSASGSPLSPPTTRRSSGTRCRAA